MTYAGQLVKGNIKEERQELENMIRSLGKIPR